MCKTKRKMKRKIKVALIKEYRIDKLFKILNCFYCFPFNRDGLRDCILRLYKGKDEKSVFRGMVIPSLRHLGLILGYEEDLRLSANGNLLVLARKQSIKEGMRLFRVLLTEMDDDVLKIHKIIEREAMPLTEFKEIIINKIDAPSEKQAKERAEHWLSMYLDLGLLVKKDVRIEIAKKKYLCAKKDLNIETKTQYFKNHFFDSYYSLFKKQENVPIIDIADIRLEVAQRFYKKQNLVLTEKQFDILLRMMPFLTDEYMISLGRAMGAEEKVFKYGDNYYRTLSVRFLKKED